MSAGLTPTSRATAENETFVALVCERPLWIRLIARSNSLVRIGAAVTACYLSRRSLIAPIRGDSGLGRAGLVPDRSVQYRDIGLLPASGRACLGRYGRARGL